MLSNSVIRPESVVGIWLDIKTVEKIGRITVAVFNEERATVTLGVTIRLFNP